VGRPPGIPVHEFGADLLDVGEIDRIEEEHDVPAAPAGGGGDDPVEAHERRGGGNLLGAVVEHLAIAPWLDAEPAQLLHARQNDGAPGPDPELVEAVLHPRGEHRLAAGEVVVHLGDCAVRLLRAIEDRKRRRVPAAGAARAVEDRASRPDHAPHRAVKCFALDLAEGVEQAVVMGPPPIDHSEIDPAVEPLDDLEHLPRPAVDDQVVGTRAR
jgi:hypothetical protein